MKMSSEYPKRALPLSWISLRAAQFHNTAFYCSYMAPVCCPAEDRPGLGMDQAWLEKEAELPLTFGATINSPPGHQLLMLYFPDTSGPESQSCQYLILSGVS